MPGGGIPQETVATEREASPDVWPLRWFFERTVGLNQAIFTM